MIVDISFFNFWHEIESINEYNKFLNAIFIALEHIPLPPDVYTINYKNRSISIDIPINYYFKLCFLRAQSSTIEEERIYYFSKAVSTFEKPKFKKFRQKYSSFYEMAKPYYVKGYKPPYRILYGDEIANDMKNNLKEKMSSLPDDIIKKRNAKISLGMQNYFHHQETN